MSIKDTQEYIRSRIADYCVEIEDIFKKDIPRYVTVIVRPQGKPDQEVIVTADPDPKAIIETVQRRFAIGEATDEDIIDLGVRYAEGELSDEAFVAAVRGVRR